MPTFFSVRRLGAAYGDIQALWDVSLEVVEGEIVALIGPNGAGKTTLMRAIAGLHRPLAGEVMLNGVPLHSLAAYRIADQGVILVPEGRRLFGGLTVRDNLELGAYTRRARDKRAQTMQEVFALFPLLAERQAQHHERGPAANVGYRPGAHGAAPPVDARRAIAGAGPPTGRKHL
jgi:branched-chain amino acid transport system ATP-binding protein